jgi:hypothetical protein
MTWNEKIVDSVEDANQQFQLMVQKKKEEQIETPKASKGLVSSVSPNSLT